VLSITNTEVGTTAKVKTAGACVMYAWDLQDRCSKPLLGNKFQPATTTQTKKATTTDTDIPTCLVALKLEYNETMACMTETQAAA
jgi:hypothetical protein